MTKHDEKCPNFTGSCCSWLKDCTCQCMCDYIREIRKDEAEKAYMRVSAVTGWYDASMDMDVCDWEEAESAARGNGMYDKVEDPKVCRKCLKNCSEPLSMDKKTRRVYYALFGPQKVLPWSEADDCGSRDLMLKIALAAAYPKKITNNKKRGN